MDVRGYSMNSQGPRLTVIHGIGNKRFRARIATGRMITAVKALALALLDLLRVPLE